MTYSDQPEDFYASFSDDTKDPVSRWEDMPQSWSQVNAWESSRPTWYRSYVLGQKPRPTPAMVFGNVVGDRLASDPTYLPSIPRLKTFERTIKDVWQGVRVIGHIDNSEDNIIHEFKTGVTPWTQRKVDHHRQLDVYTALLWNTHKINPKDIVIKLFWIPTNQVVVVNEEGNYDTEIVISGDPVVFETQRTMFDVLHIMSDFEIAHNGMTQYIAERHSR
jgi:hypothetical protein